MTSSLHDGSAVAKASRQTFPGKDEAPLTRYEKTAEDKDGFMFFAREGKKNGRGCFYCPEKFSSLEKVRDNRKLLTALYCSKTVSK